jgi:glycosyltransferase involved in cell wall biosynthesis
MSITTSVIICAYNYARFLPCCLESVLSQSQAANEIILVDDGSTDETPYVMSRFPSVRYVRQNRAGKAEAFNRGFRESRGDLICHLDADDYWLPEKLERVTESLSHEGSGGLVHETFYVDGEGRYLYGSEHQKEAATSSCLFSFQDVLALCFIYRPWNTVAPGLGVANTICVRRDAVVDSLPLPADLQLAVDGALLLSAARHGLLHLSAKLSVYRHHGRNHFVSDPENQKYQRRLFNWVSSIPGIVSLKDRKLLEALILEIGAHSAVHNGGEPLTAAGNATVLLLKLARLGLVPNWKHFGLPIASLVGWKRIRSLLRPGD